METLADTNGMMCSSQNTSDEGRESVTALVPPLRTVIKESVYVGDTDDYIAHVIQQSLKTPAELFCDSQLHQSCSSIEGNAFQGIRDVFSLGKDVPLFPDEIRLEAQRVKAPGMRLWKPPKKEMGKVQKAKQKAKTAKNKTNGVIKLLSGRLLLSPTVVRQFLPFCDSEVLRESEWDCVSKWGER